MNQGGIWRRRKLSIKGNGLNVPAGLRPRPASAPEGSQLCRKESSSPDPESGEQWTKTQGARKPSAVLSADVCLSVCLSSVLRVCVCAGIVSGLILFWCIILFLLPFFSDLPSTPTLFRSFSEQANGCGGN